jgi:predicted NAD-dependent protein-ADP-ribosyltransferase YbiA (DUF1768 family)
MFQEGNLDPSIRPPDFQTDDPIDDQVIVDIDNDNLDNFGLFDVDGLRYMSENHYAKQFLIDMITGLKDSRPIPLHVSDEKFEVLLSNALETKKRSLVTDALDAKFKQHPILEFVLNWTFNKSIIWGDKNDNILGIGSGTGKNAVGIWIETHRETQRKLRSKTRQPLEEQYLSTIPSKNIVVRTWLVARFQDLLNALKTFKTPNVKQLAELYKFTVSKEFANFPEKELESVRIPHLKSNFETLWMVTYPQYFIFDKLDSNELIALLFVSSTKNFETVNQKNGVDFITAFHKKYEDNMQYDVDEFVRRILSGTPNSSVSDTVNLKRINYWSYNKSK